MPVEKVSLSLDAGVVAEARAASGGNLSAYVNDAVAARLRNRDLRSWLDEVEPEFGPAVPEEDADLRRRLAEAGAAAETGRRELEALLLEGGEVLGEHPLVAEAVVALGPVGTPIAYVTVADQARSIDEVASGLQEHLRRRLPGAWEVAIVLVPRAPQAPGLRDRPLLPLLTPL